MPLRLAITKASGQNEQLVIDACQWNPVTGEIMHDLNSLHELFDEGLRAADARLMEMNTRMLEAYSLESYFDPGSWQQVVAILDILAGRQSAAMVKQRWDAVIEENAMLDQGRKEALHKAVYEHDVKEF